MKRPSKKEIKAAIEGLKDSKPAEKPRDMHVGQLSAKKTSKRIRKQGAI